MNSCLLCVPQYTRISDWQRVGNVDQMLIDNAPLSQGTKVCVYVQISKMKNTESSIKKVMDSLISKDNLSTVGKWHYFPQVSAKA